jgi:hypothetical protein
MRSALLVAVFTLLAVPARAQSTDARWESWLGCWTLATENLRGTEPQGGVPQATARPSTVREGAPRVCVSSAANGARFLTTVGTLSAIDQTIVADGNPHPVSDADCSGTQRTEWSKNGLRLFSSAEIRCKGDEGLRRVSGISLIAPNGDWLDIQTVAVGPRETISVKRYYRADDSPRPSRPSVVSSRLTLDEVKEASSKVSSAAVEAALVETNAGFDLSKKTVLDLASAGVSDRLIDLVVALSYPEKFVIQRTGQAGGYPVPTTYRGSVFYDPLFYDGYYGSPYFYEPFGYRGVVVIGGGALVDGGGSGESRSPGVARVINGQGYTRIAPRDSTPATTNTQSTRTASTSGTSAPVSSDSGSSSSSSGSSSSGSSSSGSSSSGSSSSGSSGGGSVSPSGASSGGGSSDSGRTAVPR